MARLELVAGNFGTGRADWINFEFHLPRRVKLPVEEIASVEENGDYLERSVLGFLKGGASGAIGLGATAAAVGLFAAPLAAVGAIGLTAAAIGGGIGAFGGSVERKVLLQVVALDGRGFVAICEKEVPAEIRKAVSVVHALRMRQPAVTTETPKPVRSLWGRAPRPVAPAAIVAATTIAAPGVAAALPAPSQTVELTQDKEGVFSIATDAITSVAESATSLAGDACVAATDAAGDAWAALRARIPWSGSSR
ncbi:hypothetical protein BHAOGJBA_6048 [Methylobacterium hispanicum]|uniref:Tail tape measure protein n=1 Tax=Methylobacterium hispanicum TaxID=270350 RepID=A0AAV4ZV86_9HYPH|nr:MULTISPECIES: hypothetical protein [Methylobacterium]GJD92494.1 hypothetical protein BHAOGJBA_6048 [Methylobacterium hispanicum]